VKIIGEIIGRKGKFYRWGGDEFAVCLPDFSSEEAKVSAERIRYAVERSQSGGGIAVTTSIGVYATDRSTDTKTANEILHLADKAMYESKEHGKNRVTVWPFSSEAPK
jgi:diguanylate cyclase (GGDEF)-like protein